MEMEGAHAVEKDQQVEHQLRRIGDQLVEREKQMDDAYRREERLARQNQKLRTQLKDAAEALASEKARAAGASEKVERAESLAHRKVALAEEKRDLMAARLEAAMAASQAAIVGPLPFGAPFSILCALSLVSFVIGPFAAATSLRNGLD